MQLKQINFMAEQRIRSIFLWARKSLPLKNPFSFSFSTFHNLNMDEEINNIANTKPEGESSVRCEWPELLGLTGEEAKKRIKEENPALDLHVVGPDSLVNLDFRSDRVRIWVDYEGKVMLPPSIG
ncbi:hypothetical protein M5K25_006376 [Dendrobium thyrsiflorum]|uniref:Uncharacterized protein n=1 Tax=Dendrobium thyrsiflorum TaxID=117978 RepID=A0ABD0VIM5_DENTH